MDIRGAIGPLYGREAGTGIHASRPLVCRNASEDWAAVHSLSDQKGKSVAEFSVIKESEAPRPTRQTGRLAARMREYERFVEGVPSGKIGKLQPSRGETPRGVALRVSRAAKRMNKSINTWVVDDVVYFSVA